MADQESPVEGVNLGRIRKLQSFVNTDAGNAEAFELLHGDRFRFDHNKQKWLVWNGRHWAEDENGEAQRAALETVRERLSAAIFMRDKEDQQGDIKWALGSQSVYRRRAMLISAQSIKSLATNTKDYDRDPFLLTVGNGTLDLHNGKLREARLEDLIIRATQVPYDQSATAPRWMRFLDEIFGGETEVIEYVQRAVGYSLTGDTREQCFFLLCGGGANGKSTCLETIVKLFGSHATTAEFDTFLEQNRSGPRNDLARFCGARFVKAAEAGHGTELSSSIMKQLTGEDTISARFLYHEAFEYRPTFKIWLATNVKPAIWETNNAIWRRIKLIEFNRQFMGPKADPLLREKLKSELPGILKWAVDGCLAWQKFGLKEPHRITRATEDFRLESDQVGRYLKDRCQLQQTLQTPAKKLYDDYVLWCAKQHEVPVANNPFAAKLAERGLRSKRITKGVVYLGVGLLPVVPTDRAAMITPRGGDK